MILRPVPLAGWLLLLLATPCTAFAYAQEAVEAKVAQLPQTELQQEVVQMLRGVDREVGIDIGFRVEDLDGTIVADYRGGQEMALASNAKLWTTSAALFALGEDFHWRTRAFLEGNHLIVVGGGDPSLRTLPGNHADDAFLDELAQALKDAGTPQLQKLSIDGSYFQANGPHPLWPKDQLSFEYTAPVSALSVNGGMVELSWSAKAPTVRPAVGSAIRLRTVQENGSSLAAWWKNAREIHIRSPRNGKASQVAFTQRDALQFAGLWLQEGLRRRGIQVANLEFVEEAHQSTQAPILDWQSAWSLADVVVACNKESDNYLAEVLLLTLGQELRQEGSWEAGVEVIQQTLSEAGLEDFVLNLADGSGMARDWPRVVNVSRPQDICQLLRLMATKDQGRVFFDSLPIGGVDGSLKQRFQESVFQPQRVHAKTGFIMRVSSLSGYVLDDEDRVLVFSFVVYFDRSKNKQTNNKRFRELRQDLLRLVLEAAS